MLFERTIATAVALIMGLIVLFCIRSFRDPSLFDFKIAAVLLITLVKLFSIWCRSSVGLSRTGAFRPK
jgi:hypothetical protein